MKSFFSILALVMAVSAQANTVQTVYRPDTILPAQLRIDILKYVESHCGDYVTPYGLNELETKVTQSNDVPGYSETRYVTKFSSMNYALDPYHPDWADIMVYSSVIIEDQVGPLYLVDVATANDWRCN
jgi:hypothetical protein